MKQMGKMMSHRGFVTIQVKKGGCYVTATSRPPPGLGVRKIPRRFVWSQNVTVDVVNPRRLFWVDIFWVSKCY
jgi:hypothetical protein